MSGDETIGTCFGFSVRSSLPFHYLRGGAGQTLDVSAPSRDDGEEGELIWEWTPTPSAPFEGRLVRAGSGFRLWEVSSGWFSIDPGGPSVTVPEMSNVVRREERLWGIPVSLCLRARGDVVVHAAAVEVAGNALVLGAPRTFGKTTLTAAFHNAGHRLLTEDVTCIGAPKAPAVVPGPAMLRVRHDVAERLDVRDATPVGEKDDRIHLALDPAGRGDCDPVPLRAIVLLRPSDDGLRLERVPAARAVRDLWSLSFRLPTDGDRARAFSEIVDLVQAVPVWDLHRPLRIEDLPATVEFLAQHA